MGKIAVNRAPSPNHPAAPADTAPLQLRSLAAGDGWSISDILCTAGPNDRAFEEQHSLVSIAVVLSGTFQYRGSIGHEIMTPGSLLLGNPHACFECGHEHSTGDRCISFRFSEEFCERAGISLKQPFRIARLPALRAVSPLTARAALLPQGRFDHHRMQEIAFQVLDRAMHLQHGLSGRKHAPSPASLARVTRVLRAIEVHPEQPHALADLAAQARLSPYHFLRCFEDLTGTTPRQYILRTRLRRAALRLKQDSARIIDIALDCGFGDVSHFNHAFRAEFGTSPRLYRAS